MRWTYTTLFLLINFNCFAKYIDIPDTNYIGKRPCNTINSCEDLARRDDEYARTTLALLYIETKPQEIKTVKKGMAILRESANNKYHLAEAILGLMYKNGQYVKQSDVTAATWLLRSAISGFALAQYHIGMMYLEGQGVSKNIQEAVYWIKQGASRGQLDSMKQLAIMYIQGNGVERNVKRGMAWMEKATSTCPITRIKR